MKKKSPFSALLFLDSDHREHDRVFTLLEQRLTAVAKKRVPPEMVQDIVQDTLLILLKKLPTLGSDRNVLPLAFSILRRLIGNYYQSESTVRKFRAMNTEEPLTTPGDHVEESIYAQQILEKCEKLNGNYAKIVKLVLAGYSTDEIIDELGVSSRQGLYNMIYRGRNLLKEFIKENRTP